MDKERKVSRYDMLELALYHTLKIDHSQKHEQVMKVLEELVELMKDELKEERDRYASF